MIRFILRLLAILSAAVAVLIIVVDATRSLGASSFVVTSFRTLWQSVSPEGPSVVAGWLSQHLHPVFGDVLLATVLACPAALLFGILALLMTVLARERLSTFRAKTNQ